MKINYDQLFFYQEYWRETKEISEAMANKLIDLSTNLIAKAKANNDELDGIVLLYPEDCEDYDVFRDFAYVMLAYIFVREENGLRMEKWGLRHELEVE